MLKPPSLPHQIAHTTLQPHTHDRNLASDEIPQVGYFACWKLGRELKSRHQIIFMRWLFITLVIGCCALPVSAVAGAGNGPLKLIVTLFTGVAAAGAAKNADAENTLFQEKGTLADKLRSEGIDPANRAIYSAYLQLDKNADAVYWERWFGWPNVILEVEIAGQGNFLIPRIDQSYQGQPILENLIGQYASPGTRIIVHVLDDKQFQNAVWNSILKTKINFSVSSGVVANNLVNLTLQADGSFQIIDKNVEIVSPVCIATADFNVPESTDGRWLANADFRDKDNNVIGVLQFQQMWSNPIVEAQKAHSSYVFWVVVAVFCILVFAKCLFSKPTSTQ